MQTQNAQDEESVTASFDAIVVGAGVSGMYAIHYLRDELGLQVRGFDSASDVGGTWWYNRYPGARVDAPSSPFYAYTFSEDLAKEWSWTETQSTSDQVRAYLEHVADRFDLRKDIAFETWLDETFLTSVSNDGISVHAMDLISRRNFLSAPWARYLWRIAPTI